METHEDPPECMWKSMGLWDHQNRCPHYSEPWAGPCYRNEAFVSSVSELWGFWNLTRGFRVLFPLASHMFPEASQADLSNTPWAAHCGQGVWVRILIEQLTSCVTKGNCGCLRFFTYQMKIVIYPAPYRDHLGAKDSLEGTGLTPKWSSVYGSWLYIWMYVTHLRLISIASNRKSRMSH